MSADDAVTPKSTETFNAMTVLMRHVQLQLEAWVPSVPFEIEEDVFASIQTAKQLAGEVASWGASSPSREEKAKVVDRIYKFRDSVHELARLYGYTLE